MEEAFMGTLWINRHWCTIAVPLFQGDFKIIPIEAVGGQIFWGWERGLGGGF